MGMAGVGATHVEYVPMESAVNGGGSRGLGIFLAAAMFVFVIDTSFMNVSISAVVHDLEHDG
jgi:hypothetical protein